jgi:predicted membrane-bound spermidine synthase
MSSGLRALFFVSGCAALLYQIVWQRTLFSIYGINVEAVTMVVTVFMLGLGLGSLAGGTISKNPKRPAVLYFAIAECSIGVFGIFSLAIFHRVGTLTLELPPLQIALVTFGLLLLPTMLMGGTLPLLVAHFSRLSKNVGDSVARLYYVNTLGSAAASALAVTFLLGKLGQAHTLQVAAALNFVAGLGSLVLHARSKRKIAQTVAAS